MRLGTLPRPALMDANGSGTEPAVASTATVTAGTPDPNLHDNAATVTTRVG